MFDQNNSRWICDSGEYIAIIIMILGRKDVAARRQQVKQPDSISLSLSFSLSHTNTHPISRSIYLSLTFNVYLLYMRTMSERITSFQNKVLLRQLLLWIPSAKLYGRCPRSSTISSLMLSSMQRNAVSVLRSPAPLDIFLVDVILWIFKHRCNNNNINQYFG